MNLGELTVLLLGLAISSVLLHGLYVSVQACKSQLKLAIANNIPQDFDLDSLEPATPPRNGAVAQHSHDTETAPQHPQAAETGQNPTNTTTNQTQDPLAQASARAASLQLDRNAEPIPMLIDSVTLSHKAMQPGQENEDGMKKDSQNEATFEIMDYADGRETELPTADNGQPAGADPKTPDEFSGLGFVKTLADHESAYGIPENTSGYGADRPPPGHDDSAEGGFDQTNFDETDLNEEQSNEREPGLGNHAGEGNASDTNEARGENGEMWEAQARQEEQIGQSQQNEADDILLDYRTDANSDTNVDDGMAAVRPDYPEDSELGSDNPEDAGHNGDYADTESSASPDEITLTAGERIGFQSSDRTAPANHGVPGTLGKRTSLFTTFLNKIAQPLAARDGKQRTKKRTAGWLKQIRQNGLRYQTGAEFWEEMGGSTRVESREGIAEEARERVLMQTNGIDPLTDAEISPIEEHQQQPTTTQDAQAQSAKTRPGDQRDRAEPTIAEPYREPVQQELADFQSEPEQEENPPQNGSAPASHKVNQHQTTNQSKPQPMEAEQQPSLESKPSELLVLNLMAYQGRVFNGDDLLRAVITRGLQFGEMNIFHYRENNQPKGPVVFSLANILKPGTFDLNTMSGFNTVGVTLFLSLPVADSYTNGNSQAFEQMLTVARDLCAALDGELRDDHRNLMTAQTIEHYRQRVRDFELKLLQAANARTNVNQHRHKQPDIRTSY